MAGAILIIGVGVVFLLNNLGVLDWDVWHSLWRLWPLLLIAAGLDLMFGRRLLGRLAATLLFFLLLVPIAFLFAAPRGPERTEALSVPLAEARRAEVRLDVGVAHLRLGAHDLPGVLLEGTVVLAGSESIEQQNEREGDTLELHVAQSAHGLAFGSWHSHDPSWNLRLSRTVPLALEVNTGVGKADLDLRELTLTSLDVDTGVGQTVLLLPARGHFSASVHGGVGQTVVRIPKTLAAQIEAHSGIGSIDVRGSFEKDGRTYRSAGFEAAENRVEIEIDGGVGAIRIETVPADEPPPALPAELPPEAPVTPVPPSPLPATP